MKPVYTQLKYNSRTSYAMKHFCFCHFFPSFSPPDFALRKGRRDITQRGRREVWWEEWNKECGKQITDQTGRQAIIIHYKVFTMSSFQFKHSSIPEAIQVIHMIGFISFITVPPI